MTHRSEALQSFVGVAGLAFDEFAQDPNSRRSVRQIFAALQTTGTERPSLGSRLPVCSHLHGALSVETAHETLRRLIDQFKTIEPMLEWRRRSINDSSASDNFVDGHANAMVIGPSGLEDRKDIWLGVTLMAPNVRYPDHVHAPEEVYLTLSKGEFRQEDEAWFSPGIGGSFYNRPNIRHAMRSVETPLFAFWALLAHAVS
jgi:hypothetical protein